MRCWIQVMRLAFSQLALLIAFGNMHAMGQGPVGPVASERGAVIGIPVYTRDDGMDSVHIVGSNAGKRSIVSACLVLNTDELEKPLHSRIMRSDEDGVFKTRFDIPPDANRNKIRVILRSNNVYTTLDVDVPNNPGSIDDFDPDEVVLDDEVEDYAGDDVKIPAKFGAAYALQSAQICRDGSNYYLHVHGNSAYPGECVNITYDEDPSSPNPTMTVIVIAKYSGKFCAVIPVPGPGPDPQAIVIAETTYDTSSVPVPVGSVPCPMSNFPNWYCDSFRNAVEEEHLDTVPPPPIGPSPIQ